MTPEIQIYGFLELLWDLSSFGSKYLLDFQMRIFINEIECDSFGIPMQNVTRKYFF